MPEVRFLERTGYGHRDFPEDSVHDLDKETIAALGSSVSPAEGEKHSDAAPVEKRKPQAEPETKDIEAPENKMVKGALVKK